MHYLIPINTTYYCPLRSREINVFYLFYLFVYRGRKTEREGRGEAIVASVSRQEGGGGDGPNEDDSKKSMGLCRKRIRFIEDNAKSLRLSKRKTDF